MNVLEWAMAEHAEEPPADRYCRTEDDWRGRFTKFVPYVQSDGVADHNLSLVASIVGEIGDNCFTHNIGSWRDIPGCWFEWEVRPESRELRWVIADRGQGILASFTVVRPDLATHHEALRVALTEQITSRQPEDRGRGLKVVMRTLGILGAGSFLFRSGDAQFFCTIPLGVGVVPQHIQSADGMVLGTYCEMVYRYAV